VTGPGFDLVLLLLAALFRQGRESVGKSEHGCILSISTSDSREVFFCGERFGKETFPFPSDAFSLSPNALDLSPSPSLSFPPSSSLNPSTYSSTSFVLPSTCLGSLQQSAGLLQTSRRKRSFKESVSSTSPPFFWKQLARSGCRGSTHLSPRRENSDG